MLLPPSRMRCQVRKEIPTTLSRATLQTKDLTKYLWKKYQLTKQEDLLILQMTVMNGNMQKMTKERSRSKVRGHRRAKLKSVAVRCSSSKGPGSGPSRQSCPKSAISIAASGAAAEDRTKATRGSLQLHPNPSANIPLLIFKKCWSCS